MVRHIGPNLVAPLTVQLSFAVGLGILAESTLTYLGLGVNPIDPDLGSGAQRGPRLRPPGLVDQRLPRVWPSSSPSWRSTCSAMASATRSMCAV